MVNKDCNANSAHTGCPIVMTDTASYGDDLLLVVLLVAESLKKKAFRNVYA